MMIKVTFALALTILIAVVPALGQEQGTFELGAFGKAAFLDESLDNNPALGGGVRAGYYFLHNLMLEVDGAIATPDLPLGESNYWPIHARVIYALPLSETVSFLLGGGYTHNVWGQGLSGNEDGAGGLVGLRWNFSESWGVRIDGIGDYLPAPTNGADNNVDWGIQAGLSFLLSAGGPKDNDGDGVPDKADACPDTPRGVKVDARGCPVPVDSDTDGVVDSNDNCPDTPRGVKVDARGCPVPVDSDADGVVDSKDNCPDTPRGVKVDAQGCPVPMDSDADGVMDSKDNCPDTPRGVKVDARGCPVSVDSDADGVMDPKDNCPDTPRGVKVDAQGCPRTVILEGVNFATNSAELTPGANAVLDRVAESLVANPDVHVEISGHTDNFGSREHNLRLSQSRAGSVRNYLISRGVLPENVEARGYGPDQPLSSNDTPQGRAQNRRVEMSRLN